MGTLNGHTHTKKNSTKIKAKVNWLIQVKRGHDLIEVSMTIVGTWRRRECRKLSRTGCTSFADICKGFSISVYLFGSYTQELILALYFGRLESHLGCLRSNLGQQFIRQVSCLLYNLSSPGFGFWLAYLLRPFPMSLGGGGDGKGML